MNHFLFLHFFDPHWPYLPPADFLERFGPRPHDISDLLDTIASDSPPASPSDVQQVVNLYDAEIAFADREIGRFLDELRKRGLYDRSLIILTGDHGESFWEHGIWEHTSTLYEELIRVPLIIKWPQNTIRGRFTRQVSQTDIFATILTAAGLAPPESWGMDIASWVRDESQGPARWNTVSEVTWRSPGGTLMKIAFRSEELKYIATLEGAPASDWDGLELVQEELYNLADDPTELVDISGESHEQIGMFRRELELFLQEAENRGANRMSEGVTLNEITKQRLRSLGYIIQ
jgi:arylsulfatase A-like enzyme